MRIFLDANILFSAAYSDAALRRLINDLEAASCSLVADRYVFEEALRNLTIQRAEAVPRLHVLVSVLTIVSTHISSSAIPPDVHLPDKDIPVLASAIEAGCDILMTGDSRHFGPLFGRSIEGLSIRSPVETAKHILGCH
ncbi:MAG: PIN domain-containing protein [Spirochaetia bacterium]|nr:PIN domain-containing protein [Spirochaetia bacterium]